jgi:RNA polymerase sigma factor (sigma-70 family)
LDQRLQSRGFKHIVDEYGDLVMTICKRILLEETLAEEATQDAFLKVYRSWHKFRGDSSVKTWIYRIAYHTAIDYARKKKRKTVSLEEIQGTSHPVEAADAQDQMEDQDQSAWVHGAIALLPTDQAALITLYYMENKNIREVCEITGLSESNVKIKLFRARKLLADILVKSKKT